MSAYLYEASVPVFLHYLERLDRLVDIAQSHAEAHGLAADELLAARLAPDMLPLEGQVQVAANFALRACFPLVDQAVPPYGEFPAGCEGLHARIARVVALVGALQPGQFAQAPSRTLRDTAGQAVVSLPAPAFLFQYALPNFFFHLSTAYAILRSQGVALGQADFDGFHAYPARDR